MNRILFRITLILFRSHNKTDIINSEMTSFKPELTTVTMQLEEFISRLLDIIHRNVVVLGRAFYYKTYFDSFFHILLQSWHFWTAHMSLHVSSMLLQLCVFSCTVDSAEHYILVHLYSAHIKYNKLNSSFFCHILMYIIPLSS